MKSKLLSLLIFTGAVSATLQNSFENLIAQGSPQEGGIPPFIIDLDAPPLERFAEPTLHFRDQILKLY